MIRGPAITVRSVGNVTTVSPIKYVPDETPLSPLNLMQMDGVRAQAQDKKSEK